jgi:hypothetical protein
MRAMALILILAGLCLQAQAQKMIGFGGEISVMSVKPNVRLWITKNSGIELFGGIGAEFDIKPNDPEIGIKYLYAIDNKQQNRTYLGLLGKWKWVDAINSNTTINLPIPGILIGKEWLSKRINLKGYAIELGYQFGSKEKSEIISYSEGSENIFKEFPLIINFRYSLYHSK